MDLIKEATFQSNLQKLISDSELTMSQTYWIIKDMYKDIEHLYYEQLRNEIDKKKEEKIDDIPIIKE